MFYEVVQKKNPLKPNEAGKYYAHMIQAEEVGIRRLATEISRMCTITTPDVYAVCEALVQKLPAYLISGNSIRLGDFGLLKLSVSSNGNSVKDDFTAKDIESVKVLFRPGNALKRELEQITFVKK